MADLLVCNPAYFNIDYDDKDFSDSDDNQIDLFPLKG